MGIAYYLLRNKGEKMKLIIITISGAILMIGGASFHKNLIISIVAMIIGIVGITYGVIRANQDGSWL